MVALRTSRVADSTEAGPTGRRAESTHDSERRRDGSWAPLLGAIGIVLLSLVFVGLMALSGDSKAPGSPAGGPIPSATASPTEG